MKKKKSSFFSSKKAIRPLNLPKIPSNLKTSIDQGMFLLDALSAESIDAYNSAQLRLQEYFLDEFYYFASERAKRQEQLADALNRKCSSLTFKDHFRCVTAEFNHRPLSTAGSRINAIGGRFNYGSGNPAITAFPCLYLGENITTSRSEALQKDYLHPNKISLEDFCGKSMSDYRIHGSLSTIIDITFPNNLKPFLKVLQKIEPTPEILNKAILAGLSEKTSSIKKMSQLQTALLVQNWRLSITRFDIPSNSQSFGSLVKAAGIEGIRYRSKYSTGSCLAIFPENLKSGSFIELTDKSAPGIITRLDNSTALELR